jgi:dolichol-phosphate mannosyltransferase
MLLSIVIPVYNEADSLDELHAELSAVASDQNYAVEMILVDDGSTDDSWNGIRRLAETDDRVRGIRFRRNFGKAAALDAGFRAARGDRVMTLDADLQDDPIHIPEFLARIDQGYDVVSGWKQVRHDPWHKVGPSRVFNWMVSRLTGVALHDHNCGMKCYRSEVLSEVRLYGELHRFVPVLAAARGFRVGEIVVRHRPRRHGKSKYGLNRIVKGFLDLLTVKFLTGFGQRPQHLLGTIGLVSLLLGVLGMGYLALKWILSRTVWDAPIDLHETAALYYSLGLMLMGGQLLSVGILAELITSYLAGNSDAYSIAEQTPPRHATADDLEPSSHDA